MHKTDEGLEEDHMKLPGHLESINNSFSIGEGFNSLH
jgi:hypothetical protein